MEQPSVSRAFNSCKMQKREKLQDNKPHRTIRAKILQHIHQNVHRGIPVHLSVLVSTQHQVSHVPVRMVLMIFLVDNLRSLKILQCLLSIAVI